MTVMVLVIPVQVAARKWFDSGLSWPEPAALVCMIVFTFIGAAAAYRAGSHIAVTMLTDRLPPRITSYNVCYTKLLRVSETNTANGATSAWSEARQPSSWKASWRFCRAATSSL